MNIARWFSYTRLLERDLIKERHRHERERTEDRTHWETERRELEEARQRIENVVFLAHGVSQPHRNLTSVPRANTNARPPIPRAIGPIGDFGLAARNAQLLEDEQRRVDNEVQRDPSQELSEEAQERIRKAAKDKGLLSKEDGAAAVA